MNLNMDNQKFEVLCSKAYCCEWEQHALHIRRRFRRRRSSSRCMLSATVRVSSASNPVSGKRSNMITSDFARYIHMEIVGRVFILDKTPIQQGFEIYAFGASVDHDKYIDLHGRAIETTRGKRRQWSDLRRL